MLQILKSQSLDPLAGAFLIIAGQPAESPAALLAPEPVVVGSLGTGRWLLQRMADEKGIGVRLGIDYAGQQLWKLAVECVPGTEAEPPFAPAVLVWRLLREAEALAAEARDDAETAADLAPLLAYLDAADPLARLQFAQRLAMVFDRYLAFRPEWLAEWSAGRLAEAARQPETQRWQAALWRRVVAAIGLEGHAHPLERLIAELDSRGRHCPLPPRLHLFALPAMAPIYWKTFAALARHTDVFVHVQTPSPHHIADLVDEKRKARIERDRPAAAALFDVGHGLLAAFGRQAIDSARDLAKLQDMARDPDGIEPEPIDIHEAPPAGATLLAQLQRSVFELDDAVQLRLAEARGDDDFDDNSDDAPAPDRSLTFHRCHGLVRELEALHDALLARFAADRTLKPGDILVWLPALEDAAPAIHAVFGTQPRERRIAYAVSGLAQPGDGGLGQASLALLDFAASRMGVDAALDLLRLPPVARRFGLDDSALALLPDWLGGAGVRWALDAADRARHGAPADPRHTWAFGLERLLLGIAFGERGAGDEVFAATLPYAGLDDSAFDALGGLLDWARAIAELRAGLDRPRSARDWADWLGDIFARCLAPPDDAPDALARLKQSLGRIARAAHAGGYDGPVDFALLRDRLSCELDASAPGAVPQGSITFTTFGALRHHPYRVIALLGLDDAAIPRSPQPVEFDLLQGHPQGSDRARRDDDRAAFLAALLTASDAVHLSWRGFDAQTGEGLPPAIVVAELLDWLDRHGAAASGAGASAASPLKLRDRLTTNHPLHAFSPRAFGAPSAAAASGAANPPPSFRAELLPAARAIATPASQRATSPLATRPFLPRPLPAPDDDAAPDIDATLLRDFYAHPARCFLRRRLGLSTAWHDAAPEPEEPFTLDRFEAADLADDFARRLLAGADEASLRIRADADARLPSGVPGAGFATGLVDAALALERRVAPLLAVSRAPETVSIDIGARRITGRLPYVHEHGAWNLVGRSGAMRQRAELWISHLLACAWAGRQRGPTIFLFADGGALAAHLDDGDWRTPLDALVADARLGLRAPPWCPPRTAFDLLGKWKPDDEIPPRRAAEAATWAGDRNPERDDGAWRVIFGGAPDRIPDAADCAASIETPWPEPFEQLALRLYGVSRAAFIDKPKAIAALLDGWTEALA